jgi:hypothetical protein
MWTEADITVEIDEADDDVMLAVITTPSESFGS